MATPQAILDNSFLKRNSKNKSLKFISDDDDEDAVLAKKPKLSTQVAVAAKSKTVNTKGVANVKKKENSSSDSSSSDSSSSDSSSSDSSSSESSSSDSDTQDNSKKPIVKAPTVKQVVKSPTVKNVVKATTVKQVVNAPTVKKVVKTSSVNPVKKTLTVKPEPISSSESDSSSDSVSSYTKQKKLVKKTNNMLNGKSAANPVAVKKEPISAPEKQVTHGINSSKDVTAGSLVKRSIATIAPIEKNPNYKGDKYDPNYHNRYDCYNHWKNKDEYSSNSKFVFFFNFKRILYKFIDYV